MMAEFPIGLVIPVVGEEMLSLGASIWGCKYLGVQVSGQPAIEAAVLPGHRHASSSSDLRLEHVRQCHDFADQHQGRAGWLFGSHQGWQAGQRAIEVGLVRS
jgi:hypothetical protein